MSPQRASRGSSEQHADGCWHRAHQPGNGTNVPSHLYTDENPACTIKGTGYRDEATALQTIALTSQTGARRMCNFVSSTPVPSNNSVPGARFKQYWTIKAMRERAVHHPHQSQCMRDAILVFDAWLEDYVAPHPEIVRQEMKD